MACMPWNSAGRGGGREGMRMLGIYGWHAHALAWDLWIRPSGHACRLPNHDPHLSGLLSRILAHVAQLQ